MSWRNFHGMLLYNGETVRLMTEKFPCFPSRHVVSPSKECLKSLSTRKTTVRSATRQKPFSKVEKLNSRKLISRATSVCSKRCGSVPDKEQYRRFSSTVTQWGDSGNSRSLTLQASLIGSWV